MIIELPDKRYYKIGEVAEAFEVNTSLIRFWENEFDILKPKKNKKGNRLFTPEDIKNLQLIFHLVKEKGYTLEGAKNKLKEKPEKASSNHEIILKLQSIKEELLKIKNQLETLFKIIYYEKIYSLNYYYRFTDRTLSMGCWIEQYHG
jgi:DNA-binding transcriptional MerR regulator